MNTVTVAGKSIRIDYWGHLVDPSDWTEEVAKAMAGADGFELTPGHWEAINLLREHYMEYQIAPSDRTLLKEMVKRLGLESYKDVRMCLHELFPGGLAGQALRYSGFPTPVCTL